ncbi:alanyl-tRNA editing Aarsd1-like, putative [Babesia ovis]|uniref:Alanyl-tRNA editing Aarsd1-like, putative n=1 Tax=Babesia ovis TaxID=5869 RepID=A0A9W5TA71_BABOV|nr:alanyl-tRNA editing Aarsd1-like, putative [Babesia ovis]
MGIISISGRRENQLRKEMGIKNVEPYTPVDALLRLFIFPWVFLSMQLVLVPIFYRDEPRIKIEFLKGKPQMDVARGHDWLEFIQYYSFVPLAIMALIAQRSVVMKLLHRFTAIWQSIGESKYIWIWDAGSIRRNLSQYSYYEDDDSDQMVTQIRAYYANRTNGYWMEHKCNLLTTQFAKTLSTQILPLINRRYAVVAAEIREVNLCKLDDPLDVDMWEMYDTGYWSLNETRLSFDQGVPEALELSHRKNSEQSGVTLKVVSTVGENPINGGIRRPHVESYGGINDETAVWLQLEYISNIDKRFGNKVIATVEARYVTYFITYNLTRNTDRFVTDLSINKVVKMRTVIQAQVKQLRAVDNRHGSIIRRDVRVPLAVEGLVIMKAITGFLAAIILVSGKRMASFLELVQIMACISATVIFASQPYCNKVDNYVSFLCMAMGLAVKLLPGFQDTKSPWNTLTCLVLTTLIAYATVATVAFIIDSAALLWFPQDDNIEESNVIIVVKDANERLVGIIQGNCRVTIVQSLATFDDKGQVTLFPNGDRRRMPTIAVSLEHIDAASWYIPFITIAYMSNMADAFSINQSQANKTFLKNYLSSRFGTRVAQSLARRIVNHVNENKEAVCFCFYIAD